MVGISTGWLKLATMVRMLIIGGEQAVSREVAALPHKICWSPRSVIPKAVGAGTLPRSGRRWTGLATSAAAGSRHDALQRLRSGPRFAPAGPLDAVCDALAGAAWGPSRTWQSPAQNSWGGFLASQ
jgi:hypothetical protein